MIRQSLVIKGIVQGVGFRPYLLRLANSLMITGFVRNTSDGVYAEIEGEEHACGEFTAAIGRQPPVLAQIDSLRIEGMPVQGRAGFTIENSLDGEKNALISPDIGICDACAADIAEKGNRRYRYPFTNCTDCGPRYTIICDIPYDRPNTSMAAFIQCPECRREYENPADRRFHAQPNACPVCGPKLDFVVSGKTQPGDPFSWFDAFVKNGRIIAVKGLGGYNLVCDASDVTAVKRLRKVKERDDRPFAVMMRDLDTVRRYCLADEAEEKLLAGARKPIVLLRKKQPCAVAEDVAPLNSRLGVFLPYTPLHSLLMQSREALVMTSANLSDRPMIHDDLEAAAVLRDLSDAMLTHDRPIVHRMDDSVCMAVSGRTSIIRRARGYAPGPVKLKGSLRVILALGAQQKNTFCLVKGENAMLSGHIGDLDDMDTAACYESEMRDFLRLFDAQPEIIACDCHPDYVSSRTADRFKDPLEVIRVQHHRAHFASVLAEHGLEEPAIGFIFDGTGYGDDGTLWGGEMLFGSIGGSERIGHMLAAPLPGGEAAIRETWRMALSMAAASCGKNAALDLFEKDAQTAGLLLHACERGINSPLSSGMGRLFDAVAALAGIRMQVSYEGQAAMELESCLDDSETGHYGFEIRQESGGLVFDWRQLIRDIVSDSQNGAAKGKIAARFHRAVANLLADAAVLAQNQHGSRTVALSGGVFQNAWLLRHGAARLENLGFHVYLNERVPANDGGISYGQAAAASRMAAGR